MLVRPLQTADVAPVATTLARAFHDDPVFTAMLPRPGQRARALHALFEQLLLLVHLGDGVSVTTDDHAGAALWSRPGRWHLGIRELLRMAPRMLPALGTRVVASLRVLAQVDLQHPRQPHQYLRVIGCDPARQGKGVGSLLLRERLADCDARGEPAYLESSNARNVPFYRRHGFEVTRELRTSLGPSVWLMWRAPR